MKVRKILPLIFTSLIAVLTLVGCSKKSVFSEKNLKSFTLTRTYNGETFVVTKENNAYVTLSGEGEDQVKKYYVNYGSATFEYTKKVDEVKTATGEKDENDQDIYTTTYVDYVASSSSDSTVASYYKELVALKSLSFEGDSLKNNSFISQYLEGVLLDKVTDAKKAYDRGLLKVTGIAFDKVGNAPKSVTIKVEYAAKETEVKYEFSNVNSTTVEVLKEGTYDKDYKNLINDENPVVTLNFKGVGEIKVQLFTKDYEDSNVVKYFLYLLKEKFYKKAVVDAQPTSTNGVKFGANATAPEKTVTVDSTPGVKNVRGTLSMVVVADSKNTSQLILNTTKNTTYDSNAYTPVGGVVEGFDVLDALLGLTEEDFAKVSVTIKVDYKGYTYSAPSFK